MILWLTFRMSQRIVSYLTRKMQQPGTDIQTDSGIKQQTSFQGWEQQAATRKITAQPPVSPQNPDRQILVHSATVSHSLLGAKITFRWPDDDHGGVVLAMNTTELRQWLHIVYQRFRAADWNLHVWPEWIIDPDMHMPSTIRQ